MAKTFEIQKSTAEFLIFLIEGNENGVQVVYIDESILYTQKAMPQLFDEDVPATSIHPKMKVCIPINFTEN